MYSKVRWYDMCMRTVMRRLHLELLMITVVGVFVSYPVIGGGVVLPFGGPIVNIFPACISPPGIGVVIGPPTPRFLFYQPGVSFSFAFGPPRRPGQFLLGNATGFVPCLIPCFTGVCPYPPIPGGLFIIMHGSSL